LKISDFSPIPLEDRDDELDEAIGQLDLCWGCSQLSRYKQKATFYIAPDAEVDAIFGHADEPMQQVSWKKAIHNGTIKVFEKKQRAESPGSSTTSICDNDEDKPSTVSFEQGIINGTLIPVDDKQEEGEEASLRPSIADLEKYYLQEVSPSSTENLTQEPESRNCSSQKPQFEPQPDLEMSVKLLEPRDTPKSRRQDFAEESGNKRRRSGLFDSTEVKAMVCHSAESLSHDCSENIQHSIEQPAFVVTTDNDDIELPGLDETRQAQVSWGRRSSSKSPLRQENPPSPPRRRRGASRSKFRQAHENHSIDSSVSPQDLSRSFDTRTFFTFQNIPYDLNNATTNTTGNPILERSTYTMEQTSRDQRIRSSDYSRTPLSKRQSLPAIPRQHSINGDDLSQDIRARAMSIPGVVMEMESEGRDNSLSYYNHQISETSDRTSGLRMQSPSGKHVFGT
jgi:hypothetical protein